MQSKRPIKKKRVQTYAEGQIKKAQAEGAFEGLPGTGRPIPDLDGNYDEMWWLKKLLKRENISVLPRSIEVRKMMDHEKEKILELSTESLVRKRVKELNALIRKTNARIASGPSIVLSVIDEDDFVRRWREVRGS